MSESYQHIPVIVLLVGFAIIGATLVQALFARLRVPDLVGYITLGFGLRLADDRWDFLGKEGREIFLFLAEVGIICLLFHVGLSAKIGRLVRELRRATPIWLGNIVFSGALGYITARWIFSLPILSSLFVGAALTATSVGVAVAMWDEAGVIASETGALLLDLAEMDDISAVLMMSVLLAIIPALGDNNGAAVYWAIAQTAGVAALKLGLFAAGCLAFSRYLERHITRFSGAAEDSHPTLLLVLGSGFVLAAVSGMLGFSVAVGAFFAGLAFSRDPGAVRLDASFGAIYDLFVPFFFLHIGLQLDPESMTAGLGLGATLLVAAVVGKVLGTWGPAVLVMSGGPALVLGVSMVPRAEIAMLILERGKAASAGAISPHVFGAMVLVAAATSLGTPAVLRTMLVRIRNQL